MHKTELDLQRVHKVESYLQRSVIIPENPWVQRPFPKSFGHVLGFAVKKLVDQIWYFNSDIKFVI